ncbi:hypothetical protein DNTS_022844 [Danionella cerebrum]|uniref:Small ribosomal subunit protein mS25 n=1 Tax=Danionella cerebrum TaxID=2873325 RepID=A0A553PZB3_9TELE|nr:hypothetical protein DNTS_022844 [Danionella translucida]
MAMKGRYPIRRTMEYLEKGDIIFKKSVKIMSVNYNLHGERSKGAREFVLFKIPQIQYKNRWVQIVMFKDMTPSPFLRFYLDTAEQVLVDVEGKNYKEIHEHVRKILGKSESNSVHPKEIRDSPTSTRSSRGGSPPPEAMCTHENYRTGFVEVLEAEALIAKAKNSPANFGPKKYFLRECITEVEGQVPHPGRVPLPKEMRGKYKYQMRMNKDAEMDE